MVPAPRRDTRGVLIPYTQYELTDQNILRALHYVTQYLAQNRKNLTIVAVGGTVNTVLLHTRATTHDVDFYNTAFTNSELNLLREAATYAEERSSVPLGDKWLNNETGTIGGTAEHIPELMQSAQAQNDVIFRKPGLTVLAAPWSYAFVAKIGRITYGTGHAYDRQDAVVYLHEYIRRHGNVPVHVNRIREWGTRYRRNVPDVILLVECTRESTRITFVPHIFSPTPEICF
ncbi:hypothetical protein DV736_g1208, partial [Chaetothyriales sp. CBS 134916]